MNDVADVTAGGTGSEGETAAISPSVSRCPRCHADLTRCAQGARFCPRCGASQPPTASTPPALRTPLQSSASAATTPTGTTLRGTTHAGAWLQLRAAQLAAPVLPPRPIPASDDNHSLILLGYANAMYRLGYRYETGLGSGRNPEEAIRCYFKAAKLGNAAALARLAPQCVSPLPADTAPAADSRSDLRR